jgi:hypothetical protein
MRRLDDKADRAGEIRKALGSRQTGFELGFSEHIPNFDSYLEGLQ